MNHQIEVAREFMKLMTGREPPFVIRIDDPGPSKYDREPTEEEQ